MGTQLPLPKGAQPPIFGPYLLSQNGWMDQEATWYGKRLRPRLHCARCGPSSPSPKRGHSPSIFGSCLLWPKGWMDQDATWYGGRPRPRPRAKRGPSHPKNGHSRQFSAHVCCGQRAGWIKMPPLGAKVGLGTGHIVLHGDPAHPPPSKKRGTASFPIFDSHGSQLIEIYRRNSTQSVVCFRVLQY